MTGVELIAQERHRQIYDKGYSKGHDNRHSNNQLVYAAMCYACPAQKKPSGPTAFFRSKEKPAMWPWDKEEWKPSPDNRIRELTRAGALIAAEIDRLQALEKRKVEAGI